MRVVDRAVVGALLDNGDAERTLGLPGVGVRNEGVRANGFADAGLVQRLIIDRADHAVGVPVGGQVDRDAAAEQ